MTFVFLFIGFLLSYVTYHITSIQFGHLDGNLVVVGVVNRGEGCARKDAIGIYARVKVCDYLTSNPSGITMIINVQYHMKWIRRIVKTGGC